MLNTVMHGDCLELMKDIPDGSVDMILCDLPYQVTSCKWDTIIPFEPLWEQYERVIKDNGAIVLTACQPFTTKLIASNYEMFRYNWVWEKQQGTDPFMAKKRPMNNIEDITVFYNKQPLYNPQYEDGDPYVVNRDKKERKFEVNNTLMKPTTTSNSGFRYPKRVIKQKTERGLHPTQKPVALFEYLIKTYTNEGDTVLDNCAGSGTTGIASINTNRNYILMEQEKEYIDVINKRIAEHVQTVSVL